ncbi:WXG100 family type VII secretion target [Nocardia cyriacigeorgica]|uniref:WXG100 family type VII secretion target n=1 Tax=Nocardia cyriacigeorgica TaxID=135487 RepID=A0A5R8P4U9_9NOCA|nr:WXG100 family type VII secretion target [Nocardia cyriacigeorgica]TLF92278.1 WXG100 family type VII secretion target [Nocardia cyriacigeorgica]
MSESFRVDLTELDEITARLAGFLGFLTDSIAGIQQRTAALQSGWTGQSAAAAQDAFRDWLTGAQDVADGIETMRSAAAAARDRYNAAIAANLEMLGRGNGAQS